MQSTQSVRKILKYFLGGFVALIPFFILYQAMKAVSALAGGLFPEVGFVATLLISLFAIGFLGFVISKGTGSFLKSIILKRSKDGGPLAFILNIFLNLKTFSKKTEDVFKNPVYFKISEGVYKIGFITDKDVKFLTLEPDEAGKVAVYAPNPISFMGEVLFIENRMIKRIEEKDKKNIPVFLYTAGIVKKME